MSHSESRGKDYCIGESLQQILACTENKESLFSCIDLWEDYYNNIRKKSNAETCISDMNGHLDNYIAVNLLRNEKAIKDLGGVSCKKGCYYCCEQAIAISIDEAILLYVVSLEENLELDWGKIEKQAKSDMRDWNSQPVEDWVCPFLSTDKHCSLYKHRPWVCRKYLVCSNPKECDIRTESVDMTIGKVVSHEAEIAACGAWGAIGDVDTLPRQLLKAKKLRS